MTVFVILIILLVLHALMRPKADFDRENDQIIIHYWWFDTRKTYVLK